MKTKKFLKALALLLCIMVALAAFSGCSGKETEKGGEDKGGKNVTTDQGKKEDSNFNKTGYPIVKEPITLRFMHPKNPMHGDFAEMAYFKEMEKLTNIKIEFLPVDESSWAEKKNLALASGDLPDVFFNGLDVKDETMYGIQGKTLIPLNDLIENYAPNLKKVFKEYPDTKPAITAMDGNIYMLPYIADTLTVADSTLYVRGDWIREAGVKKPETLDEFYTMVKAFKQLGPDKIPISPNNFDVFKLYLINAFGELIDNLYDRDSNDKVVFVPATDQYKEMIKFINKLFTEGLLDNEVFTQKGEQANAKVTEGKVGCMTFGTLLKPEHYKSGKNETELLKPLTSQWNSKPHIRGRYPISIGHAAITKVNKYPEATMRWLDINYSDEDVAPGLNCISMWLGIRGVHWDYMNAEKTKYARLMPADSKISEIEWSNRYITPGWGPCKLVFKAVPENNPGQEMKANESVKNWFPYTVLPFPNQYLRYTAEEQSRLNTVANDVETLVKQMEAKFITGQESLDKWNEYLNNLKKAGLDDLIKIKQAAYDRYKANK
ncbi:MAG: extracellular solute-binding protein [Firmicutes bacterium]|nr:extracellular solute-binding protein [Bacillota bacterium]